MAMGVPIGRPSDMGTHMGLPTWHAHGVAGGVFRGGGGGPAVPVQPAGVLVRPKPDGREEQRPARLQGAQSEVVRAI